MKNGQGNYQGKVSGSAEGFGSEVDRCLNTPHPLAVNVGFAGVLGIGTTAGCCALMICSVSAPSLKVVIPSVILAMICGWKVADSCNDRGR